MKFIIVTVKDNTTEGNQNHGKQKISDHTHGMIEVYPVTF